MPQLKDSALGYFQIDDVPYQKGSVRVVFKGLDYGLALLGEPEQLVAPQIFSDWDDPLGTPYVTANALLADLKAFCFQV